MALSGSAVVFLVVDSLLRRLVLPLVLLSGKDICPHSYSTTKLDEKSEPFEWSLNYVHDCVLYVGVFLCIALHVQWVFSIIIHWIILLACMSCISYVVLRARHLSTYVAQPFAKMTLLSFTAWTDRQWDGFSPRLGISRRRWINWTLMFVVSHAAVIFRYNLISFAYLLLLLVIILLPGPRLKTQKGIQTPYYLTTPCSPTLRY